MVRDGLTAFNVSWPIDTLQVPSVAGEYTPFEPADHLPITFVQESNRRIY